MILLVLVLLAFFVPSPSWAQEPLELSLQEALEIALRENLSLRQEALRARAAQARALTEEGAFDPALEASLTLSRELRSTASLLAPSETHTTEGYLALKGKLRQGATYELVWEQERVWSNLGFLLLNPYYSSELRLVLTQPLFKDRGRAVQEARLKAAQAGAEAAELQSLQKAQEVALRVIQAYWELYYRGEALRVARLSLRLARETLKETRAKVQEGLLPPVEALAAEAEVYAAEKALAEARGGLQDAQDRLRLLLGLSDWQRPLRCADEPRLPQEPPEVSLKEVLRRRPQYQAARRRLREKELLRRFYANQRLLELNLYASAGLNGLGPSYGEGLQELFSGEFYSWQAGLVLSLPLGGRQAQGQYEQALAEEQEAALRLREVELSITREVLKARRALQVALKALEAARKRSLAVQERYKAERERFKVGMATLRETLNYQVRYTRALLQHKRALVDAVLAQAALKKALGILLEGAWTP
jgi:outer membrane protein TolC